MPEPVQPENPMSNPERPLEGVTPHEQAVVKRAEEEARSSSVEAVRQAGYVAPTLIGQVPETAKAIKEVRGQQQPLGGRLGAEPPGAYDEFGGGLAEAATSMLPPAERARLERERQLEYTKGSWIPEIVRVGDNPDAIREATRRFIASVEATEEIPEPHRISQVRSYLTDRLMIYSVALDPQKAQRLGLDRFGLVEREVVRELELPRLRETPEGLFEIEVTKEERDKLELLRVVPPETEDKESYLVVLDQQEVKRILRVPDAREILRETKKEERREVIPPALNRERLTALVKVCDELQKEVFVRERVYIARILYNQVAGLVDQMANLFTDNRYSRITTTEWKTLVSLEGTLPGERKFGDKIDFAMRLLGLIGEGGGEGTRRESKFPEEERDARIRAVLAHQPDEFKTILSEEDILKLVELAGKNIFCKTPNFEDDLEEVRGWVREKIGGDPDDTKAAESLAWDLFHMWGLATRFDNRRLDEDKTDPRNPRKFPAPNGWPCSDDGMKLRYLESWRKREGAQGFVHGPDGTYGKYPETLVGSFFDWAIPRNIRTVGEMRTFWEFWWGGPNPQNRNEILPGQLLRELPWNTLRKYAWWSYHLSFFFGGRESRDPRNPTSGLFEAVTHEQWDPAVLINSENLRALNKAIGYTLGGATIHGGEIQRWLRNLHPAQRGDAERRIGKRVEDFSADEFETAFLEPVKQRIRNLIFVGAITGYYQNNISTAAGAIWNYWGRGVGGFGGSPEAEANYNRLTIVLKKAGYPVELEAIKDEAIDFLKQNQYIK